MQFAPDFVKLAEAYGAAGLRVERREDVDAAIREALSITDRPIIIDFRVEKEENVYPMVPAGKSIKDIITQELI
jgi:acetolactate synthase-1/2/3 large subunit